MTIGEHLLQVADAGLALSEVPFNEDVYDHLSVLLALEDALDRGRISLTLTGSGTEHQTEIVRKMDELRTKIRTLVEQCNQEEFAQYMEARGRRLQSQFSV